jgi:hypothetical protein
MLSNEPVCNGLISREDEAVIEPHRPEDGTFSEGGPIEGASVHKPILSRDAAPSVEILEDECNAPLVVKSFFMFPVFFCIQ